KSMSSHLDAIRRYCDSHKMSVMLDEPGQQLLDVYSAKAIQLPALAEVAERKTPDGASYLILVGAHGQQWVLADQGIAFPPDFSNSGPLPGAPQVVCWRDFSAVAGQVEHVLSVHREEPIGRETLDMVMYLIALVDGARAAGFDVDKEEKRLEGFTAQLEKH